MAFNNVYCVTPRQLRPSQGAQIDELMRVLGRELPLGYREYLTTFGWGRMCEWLWVDKPEHVRDNLPEEMPLRRRLWVEQWYTNELPWLNPGPLSANDLAEAVRFGSSQEGDYFVSCPRHGNAIFMIPRHGSEIRLVEHGFFGVPELSHQVMSHDFPFFETWDRFNRWNREFDVSPDRGLIGLIATTKSHWGAEEFKQSRASLEDHPHLFVRSIGGHFTLYPEFKPNGLLKSLRVGIWYDQEAEPDVATFVEAVAVPGTASRPWHAPSEDW
jgi:hypothetical protein